jgi:hypothetical protein
MKIQIDPYDVCRRFLSDFSHTLESSIYGKIDGYLRSRNFERLVVCTSLLADGGTSYSTPQHKTLLQIEAFFKKNVDIDIGVNTEAVALQSFYDCETVCNSTNKRLDEFYLEHCDSDFELPVQKMQQYISRVLGAFSPFLENLPQRVRLTSGATSTRPRKTALPFLKVRKKAYCTSGASKYLSALSQYWGYGRFVPRFTAWNRVITVPKNWKTDRTIACEPEGNIPLQLAFDGYIKGRLRIFGIDLSDQSINQVRAREGSIDGSLATVDLSSASDTIAFNTVALLFPQEWFCYLNDVRSPCYLKDGTLVPYEKFSSMGNGSTFGIETLVFAAACYAVGSRNFTVYGDDIIMESGLIEPLRKLMSFLGFTINAEKSYWTGPYRESCGKHYSNGVDVTPYYLRYMSATKPMCCHIVNNLLALGYPGSELWAFCFDLIRSYSLPLVPFSEDSESGVWVDIHTAYKLKLLRFRNWVPQSRVYVSKSRTRRVTDIRTLFLWHLAKSHELGQNYSPCPRRRSEVIREMWHEPHRSSVVPILSHKYRRKWVTWIPPRPRCAPTGLCAWSDALAAAL